jgi:hypothetical protein
MFPFQCAYFVHKCKYRYASTMKRVLIHNIGHSIPLLRMPRPTQGCRADDDDDSDIANRS